MRSPTAPLACLLPPLEQATPDVLLERFLEHVGREGLTLYPAQEEAILELFSGKNLILATPTGSGKTLVALALHFKAMAEQRRSYYTSPIKALVSEKFFSLVRDFGARSVGMLTGDAAVNREAPILCCTAEILANLGLREGRVAPVDYVVMDEFHYYADRERGVAWQLPLLTLPQATYLLMSATLGRMDGFQRLLTELNGRETALVRSSERPVPLDFEYRDTPLHETLAHLVRAGKAPVYVVSFTQRACAEEAQNLMSVDLTTREEKRALAEELKGATFPTPYGRELARFLRHGVGVHHAGLLPRYRMLVERLAQQGRLKVICGTDTLGVGVNIPIRTVVFTQLCKYDGAGTALLGVREFQQIAGRAGRKGFDEAGSVVVQAPEHVIENLRLEQKAAADPAKRRKLVKRRPPERGYVHWDRATFDRLVAGSPEPLVSRFQVTHGMILHVLQRQEGGCRALARLLGDCHEPPHAKRAHRRTARLLLRSLLDAGVVEVTTSSGGRKRLTVHAELQEDFSLNRALSLYLVEAVALLDRESPTYALDVLTLVESILESPELILRRQLDRLRGRTVAELKAAGVEYEERLLALDKLEHPKPLREFVYTTFNAFAALHPWVGENIRPKSIAREMVELYLSFNEYVREYGLERGEGLLLRYLADAYKALVQNVPEAARTDELLEILAYLGTMVRAVDSSLLDEWERLLDPDRSARRPPAGEEGASPAPGDVTRDTRAFTALVRNALFRFVRALAVRDYGEAAALLDGEDAGGEAWTPERLERALAPYHAEHGEIRTDPAARAAHLTTLRRREGAWEVFHALLDREEHHEWGLECRVDLGRSRELERPALMLLRVGA